MSSGAVDTKTVEMRLDKENFEKNTSQVISTLAKLKEALKLDGASAGLKEVEETSKKLDFKELKDNVDGVGKKFSILEELAKGALRKIGEAAAEQGMKIAKSLTVNQLASGWSKYEQKVTAVQTIMANLRDEQVRFADEATKMDYVSGYLEKLIWFSDETSYSFTEMTSNLGKFIAVGQNLDESVTAIQGIATWAAMAGQRNAGAARAMYNISQALGVGAMTTIDWKSIENANMATAEFKETAIAAAVAMGKLKEGEVTIESFRESLQKKWFDKDVMMNVFQQYGAAAEKIQEYAISNNVNVQEAIRALKETDKDFAESLGFRAFAAAQEAKTFGEVVEATADAVSSKWLKIFENIFGNYQEAKELWTDFSEQLWEVLAQPLDVLNDIMSKWNRGFFADGPKNIIEKWFEKGKLDDLNGSLSYVTEEVANLAVNSDNATYKIITLSDGTKRLTKTVKDASGKINTYYKNIFSPGKDLVNGRTVLLQSFQNIFDTLFHDVYDKNDRLEHMSFFGAMKRGLQEVVFGTSTVERIIPKASKKMWELTNSFKEFTEKLKPSLETSHKIKNIFKGLFTTIKIGIKFVKSAIKPFKDLFSGIFERKEGERGLLDLANSMSRWVQNLDRFLERNKIYERVTEGVSSGLDKIKSGVDSLVKAWTGLSSEEYIKKLKDDVFKFFENYDFRAAFNKVVDPIRSFIEQIRQLKTGELPEELTPLQKFLTGFINVYRKIKQFFSNAIAVLGSIGEKVGTIFRSIIDAFKSFAKQIKQVVSGELPEELTPLQKFLLAIGSVFKFFKDTYEKLSMKFPEIINRIKSFKLSDFKQLITPIQTFLASIKTSISSLIDGAFGRKNVDEMSQSAKRFAPVIRAFASIFEGLGNLFESAGPYIEKVGQAIGDFLTDFGKSLDKFLGGKSGIEVLKDVVQIFTDFASGKFLLSLAKIDNRFAKLIKVFTKQVPLSMQSIRDMFKDTTKGVDGFFKTLLNHLIGKDRKTVGKAVIEDLEAIKGILTAYRREINAGALIDVALAIGALAASMWVIAQIPSERLVSSGNALAQIAGVVVLLYAAMTAIASIKSYIKDKKAEKERTIFDTIKDILTTTVQSSVFANDATAKFLKFAAGVFLIAAAIKKISSSMGEISAGIITMGEAYSDPKFKDGLKALGWLAGGIAITSLVVSLSGSSIRKLIAVFVIFGLFIKKASTVVGYVSEIGKSIDINAFYKGLNAIRWLLAVLGILSLITGIASEIGRPIRGALAAVATMWALRRFVQGVCAALSELVKASKEGNLSAATDALKSLMYPLFAFILVTNLITRNRSGRKATTRAILALIAAAIAIKLLAKSVISVAEKSGDANKMSAAADLILSLGKAVAIIIGLLAILGSSKFKLLGVQYSGKGAVFKAGLAFLAVCYGITLMIDAVSQIKNIGATSSISFYSSTVEELIKCVGWTIALLGALAGLNATYIGGTVDVNYNGKIGVPLAAIAFVGVCYGISLMAQAVKDLASGDIGDTQKAHAIIESLSETVGVITGILGGEAGLNIWKISLVGGVFSGTAGMPIAAASFETVCEALGSMAKAVVRISSAGNPDAIDKAGEVLKKLSWVLCGVLALLGLETGLNGWAIGGLAGIVFSGTAGVPFAADSFKVACEGLKDMSKAASGLASVGDIKSMDKAYEILKKLSWVLYGVLALLGLEAGLDGYATMGVAGIAVLGTLGVPIAAFSFLIACRAVEAMAKAVAEIGSLGNKENIEKAKDVLKTLSWVIYGVLGLLGFESGSEAYVDLSVIGGSYSGLTGVPTAAESFKTACGGVEDMATAVVGIAQAAKIADVSRAKELVTELATVIRDVLSIVGLQAGLEGEADVGFLSADFSGASGVETAANSFVTASEGIINLASALQTIADIENIGTIKDDAVSVIKEISDAVKDVMKLTFESAFVPERVTRQAEAFALIADSLRNLVDSLSILYNGGIFYSADGTKVSAAISSVIAGAVKGLNDIDTGIEVTTAADSLAYSIESSITGLDSETWGKDLGSNLASGMLAMVDVVRSAAEALASAIRAILGFSEPKEGPLSDFHTYAPDMIKLWNRGVYSNLGSIEASTTSIADTMYDGFSTALDYVSGLIDNGMSDQLTIRPVMDLSEIQNGVNSMNGMLSSPPTYMVTGSSRLAAAAAYGMGAMNSVATDPQATITDVGPTTNNFYISGADPDAIADRVSKILANQTRRQRATWAKKK